MSMDERKLVELEALYEKATKGPWVAGMAYQGDRDFIVALVNAWPHLRSMARDCERYRKLRGKQENLHVEIWIPGDKKHVGIWRVIRDEELDFALDAASNQENSRG